MELIFIIITAIVCSAGVVIYNNYEVLKNTQGIRQKVAEAFKFRKNTVAALLLGIPIGSGLVWLNYSCYNATMEYTIKLLMILEFLIPIAYIDYKKKIIPNVLLVGMLIAYAGFLAYEVLGAGFPVKILLLQALFGMLFGGGVMLISAIISKGGMGMGDVKLFAVLGMYLGWQGVFFVIFLSIIGVAVIGSVLIIRKKMGLKSSIPVGPFVLGAMLVSILLGI